MPQLKLTPQLVDELVRGARTDQIQRLLEVNFNTDLLDEEEIADLLRITDELGDFEIGMDYLGSALQTAKAGIADRLGFEDYAQQEVLEAARTLEEAQLRQETPITPITDVYDQEGLGSAIGYAPEFAGRTFMRSAPEMGAGLVAARLGARLPMKYGGIAGFGAVSVPAFTGRNLQRQMEEQGVGIGDTDLTKAGIAALGQAGADALLYRTIGALGPQRAGMEVAKAAERGYLSNVVKRAREGALVEAGTESFQQAVEMLQADPTLLTEFDEDTRKELMESAIAGGLIGGPIAGVSAPIETAGARAKVKEDLERHMQEQAEEAQRMADAAGLQDQLLLERDGEDLIGLPSPSDVSVLPPISVSPDGTATAPESPEIFDLSESIEENFRKRRGVLGDDRALPSPTVIEVPPTASQRGTLEGRLGGMEESVRPEGVSRTDTSPRALEGDLLPPEPAVESREPLSLPTPVIEQEPLAQRRRPESGEGPSVAALPRGTGAIPVPPTARQRGTLEGRLGGMEEVVSDVTQPDTSRAEQAILERQVAGLADPFNDTKASRLFDQLKKQEEAGQTRAAKNTKEKLGKRLVELGFTPEQSSSVLGRTTSERDQLRLLSKKVSAEQGREAREEAKRNITSAQRSEFSQKAERIRKALAKELRKLGLKDVDLRLDGLIDGRSDVEGVTDPGQNNAIITLATRIYDPDISDAELEARLREVMNHELIHALRMVGVFTDAEFQTLVNSAKNQLFVDTNGNERTFTYFQRAQRMYAGEDVRIQEEEAVAEMFRDWSAGRKKLSGAPRTFFQRIIDFFKGLGGALTSEGFSEANQIFEGIKSGELTKRDRQISANELSQTQMFSRKATSESPAFFNATDRQVDLLVDRYDYPYGSTGYAVRMPVEDFMSLTYGAGEVSKADAKRIAKEFLEDMPTNDMSEMSSLQTEADPEALAEARRQRARRRARGLEAPDEQFARFDPEKVDSQNYMGIPMLEIRQDEETGGIRVVGHEGRHRTALATIDGADTIPVQVLYKEFYNDYDTARLRGDIPRDQEFDFEGLSESRDVLQQYTDFNFASVDDTPFTATIPKGVPLFYRFKEEINNLIGPKSDPLYEEEQRMFSRKGGPRITSNGIVVGSPPGARTVAARENMVRRFLRYMEHDFAVAEISKDWYERSGEAIRSIARGDRDLIEKIARLMALYSQGNSVGGNTTALIKSIHQLASGQDTAFAGRFPETTSKRIPELLAVESFDKTVDGVNDKIENFYRNLIDPALEQDTFEEASTMDKWMMRLMGYKVADDEEKGGSSALPDTQYTYAKDIMFRLSDAWYRKTGERLKPRQVQAMLWTYIKNKKEYEKIKDPKKRKAFKPQAVDFGDYLVRATAIVPWEGRPSTSIPYLQWLHTAPRQVQEQWNEIVRNILTNSDGTDKIMSLFPAEQLYNSAIGSGAYESTVSPNVQTNIVLRKDDDRNYIYDIANKYAALMGYILSQDAAVWYRPDINAENKYAATGVNVSSNVEITPDLEEALLAHLEQTLPGIGYTKVGNELQFINFRADNRKVIAQLEAEKKYTSPKAARFVQLETDIAELKKADAKAMSGITDKKFIDMLTSALNSFDANIEFVPTTFRATSNYISNDWTRNTNGESYQDIFGSAGFGNLQQTVDNLRSDIRKAAQEFNDRRAELLGDDARESLAADGRERSGTGVDGRQGRFGYPVYESGRLGPEQGRSSFEGYHYSGRDGLTSLDSGKHGTGKAGAELQRGWRPRVYFYVQQTEGRPDPEQALSRLPNGYGVALENIYNPYKDDYIKQAVKAQNQGIYNPDMYEDMVEAEGYDGYIEWGFKPSPAVVLLGNNNVPVVQDMRDGETVDRSGVETEKGASALSADGPNGRRYSKRFSYQQSGNPRGFEAFADSIISDGASTGPFTDFARSMLGAAPNESLWNAFVRNSINRFLPGYLLDETVYGESVDNPDSVGRAMEMSQQMLGRMMAIMEFGPIQVDKDGNVSQVSNTNVKGLNEIFAPLVEGQTEEQAARNEKNFYAYAALRREKALRAKGRRGFVKLTDDVIDQQIAQVPPQFAKIFDDYQEFNGYMVKFAMDSGLMNQQMADEFAEMAYVPFYREMETADGDTDFSNSLPQRASNSLMKPGAFDEKLLGSNFKISGDLFNNIYRNNELIISSGLRNIAMQKTAQALDKTTDSTWGERVSEKETGPQIMKFRENGNEVRYRINDGSLWMALAGLTPQQKDAWVKTTEQFSNILRMGVTNMPGFMLANLWRGKVDAYVKMGVPIGMGTNTMRRMNDAYKNGDSTMAIKTLTGFGGYAFGADPSDFGKVARRKARTAGKIFGDDVGIRDALLNLKQAVETVGETTEMEVRVGVYEKLIAEGVSEREAAFQAMNLINYGRKGAGGGGLGFLLVNRILPAVPFMNARIQGLYRLIEQPGVPANKRQEYWNAIMQRGVLVAAASSAIGIMAMMDDRWEDESLETKANYDIIYVGDYTIKIPRAFEIGAVFGGFPVFMLDAIRQKDGIDLAKFTAFTFANTFAFNPIPQAALPALEVMTGYDFFRGAPIEGMGLQRKAVEDRYYSSTPYFYRFLSRNGGAALGLSPLELQQLIEGYLAGMATVLISGGETLAGPLLPSKPNGVFGNPYITTPARALGLTRFIQEDGERSSQFVKEFYELRREADQVHQSIQAAALEGDSDRIKELLEDNKAAIGLRKSFNKLARQMSEINSAMNRITESPTMSAQEKTDKLRKLRIAKNKLARQMVTIAERYE